MSVQVEKLENNTAKLTIEVSAEEFEKACEAAFQKNKNKFNIPGFRKGKVPRQMVEKMYGPSVFFEDAVNSVIPKAYADAADESGLEIVAQPDIEVTKVAHGEPMEFTAVVTLKPEVELGQYKAVEVKKADTAVTEEEVTAEIDKTRKQNARTVTIEDRPIAMGDKATIDFEGFVDGVAFEGGKGTDYPLEIGSHSFIDTFEEQLVGANIGDTVDVNVTFPDEYQAENLKGKPALFKVTVKNIQCDELPEADDDFAQEVSEFDTMDEYRADVKKSLEEKKMQAAKDEKETEVLDKVIENSKMDIPEKMVDAEGNSMMDDFTRRLQSQGLNLEQYLQYTGMTEESLTEQMKPQAVKRIQSRLVLEAVAAAENIEVSDEEVEAELQKMADAYKMELAQVKGYMGDREMAQLKKDIAVSKAATLIADAAVEVE